VESIKCATRHALTLNRRPLFLLLRAHAPIHFLFPSVVVGANLTVATNLSTTAAAPVGTDLYSSAVPGGLLLPDAGAANAAALLGLGGMGADALLMQVDVGRWSGNASSAPSGMRMCACNGGWTGAQCLMRGRYFSVS